MTSTMIPSLFKKLCLFLIVAVASTAQSCSLYCASDTIRVSISDNTFEKFSYNSVSFFCTKECRILSGSRNVAKIPANSDINVKMSNGTIFVRNNGKVIAKTPHGAASLLFTSDGGMFGVNGLKRSGKQALYRGSFDVVRHTSNSFFLVNVIPIEEYLKGVVPNEMPVHFGLSALKAQSVAARNYAIFHRKCEFKQFELFDSVASQVYFGYNTETDQSNRAVAETSGIVMMSDGAGVLARYHSTSGGCTENSENVFSDLKTDKFPGTPDRCLVGKCDFPWKSDLSVEENARKFYTTRPKSFEDDSKYFRWKYVWSEEDLRKILNRTVRENLSSGFVSANIRSSNIGKIRGIKVKHRGVSGKIMHVDVITSTGTITIKKELIFRKIFMYDGKLLPSANVVFSFEKDKSGNLLKITAHGGGYGHGVGMSQFGAAYMGQKLKKSFVDILNRYYSNVSISTVPVRITPGLKPTKKISFFAPTKNAKAVFRNIAGISKVTVTLNGKEMTFSIGGGKKSNAEFDVSKHIKHGMNTFCVKDVSAKKSRGGGASVCLEFR